MKTLMPVNPPQRSTIVIAIAGALGLMCTGVAMAQQTPSQAPDTVEPTPTKADDATTLDTITVTANLAFFVVPPAQTTFQQQRFEATAARAKAAAGMIGARVREPQRVASEGAGEADPIAPNDTEVNRARNRRIAIVLGPQ